MESEQAATDLYGSRRQASTHLLQVGRIWQYFAVQSLSGWLHLQAAEWVPQQLGLLM